MSTGRFTTARLQVAAAIASHRPASDIRQPSLVPNGRSRAPLALALALWAAALSGLAQAQTAPWLYTDRATYVAGDTVLITGRDFAPGEVTLQVTHAGGGDEPDMGHEPQTVTVQDDGTFTAHWSLRLTDLSGPDFVVTAAGDPQGDAVPAHFSRVAVVATDKGDYQPGETGVVTGWGFAPNEWVMLQVAHVNGLADGNGHEPFYALSDEAGNVTATWYVDPDDSIGSYLQLTGLGESSGVAGSATFWDLGGGSGSVGLTTSGSAYTQDFNTLANAGTANNITINGWYLNETGSSTRNNGQYAASTGSDTGGDVYSFGGAASTERAFGTLFSGTLTPVIGAQLTNNTGGTITSLDVSYTGEMWRAGVTNRNAADRLDFQLSTNAASLATGTWVDYNGLDFNSPNLNTTAGLLNGNAAGNQALLSFTITGLSIPNGASFWIRWNDFDIAPGADDGLGVDSFSITPYTSVVPPSLTITDVSANEGNAGTTSFVFVVNLSSPAGPGGVTFDIATQDASAASPGDFAAKLLTSQTIPAGSSSYSFSVLVNGDVVTEANETFFVLVTNVTGAVVVDGQGQGTIVNDDTADAAPAVVSTFPANGSTTFPVGSNLTVTFSEPVNVSASWFTLACSTSGTVATTFSGGPTTFALDPGVTLAHGETCTLTVLANQVNDQDGNDPPDQMAANVIVGFTAYDACSDYTPIYAIQGSGASAAITGNVSTKGVVVGDFEGTAAASGFYLQDLTGDGDAATSDGIFVFSGSSNLVSVGQVVRVTGFARERFNLTTINGSNSNTAAVPAANIVQCGTGSVAPADVTLPFANANFPERYEGMLVRFPQALVIAEYFNYDRFGEIVLAQPLAGETRPFTGTAIDEPGPAANARTAANALSRITLDDAQSAQNPSTLRHPNGLPFSLSNLFRGGDTVANAIGVLGYDFNLYRIIPTGPADYTATNPRPASPEPVGGTIRVAAMNTLNFFVTADYPTGDPLDNKCGPANNQECRGWDSDQVDELTRQRDKLLTALAGLDADVIGLNELENSTGVEPMASITSGLPGYAYINTGAIGTDAIKVGLIYRPAVVTPVGAFQLLTSAVDPRFIDTKSRPSLAQTFEVNATGARFTVAINHFKSKGSACDDVGDPDLLDGQGNCSQTRRAAAEALVDWLATDPTGSGDPDFLILGDLNSYAKEDTLDEIRAGSDDTAGTNDDFTNLIDQFHGAFAYSYTFDGQAGYLDHALASTSLSGQVTGAADWHINSDEPDVLDYDTTFKPPAQDALYEVNPYRTSDHDAVVVGLVPNAPPTVDAGGPYSAPEGGSTTLTASGSDPNGDSLTYAWDLDNNGSFETSGQSVSFNAALLDGPSSYTVKARATDPGGLSAVSSATVNVTNVAPTVGASFGAGSISCGPNNATLTVTFSDPAATDTHSAVINWGDGNTQTVSTATSPLVLSHTYAAAGNYTATVGVSDDDGGTGNATASVLVKLNTSGFLQPINADGTSVFKYNSTIPVKISFTNCDGSTPADLAPTLRLTMISGATPGLPINEPVSSSAADTTGVMRFSTNQYIYNLASKPLPDSSATYLITVTTPSNGQTFTVQFGLRP
ncbi:MAG TPA: ExeM/NucH family extracellular endonuclease [Thermoanaerobaculia bacterium]|nr:ExeM/NucH family extracellular endonuclease [Thermoanaerobaculia bacterium]